MKIMIFHYHIYFPFPILAPNFHQFVLTYFCSTRQNCSKHRAKTQWQSERHWANRDSNRKL